MNINEMTQKEFFEHNIRFVLNRYGRHDPNWREHLKWVFGLRRKYRDA